MTTLSKNTRDSRLLGGLGLLAGLLVLAFGALSVSPVTGDSTVGSLPSADDGDGSQNFYVTGPRGEVEAAIADAWGDGFYVLVPLPDGHVWIEFYGDVTVVFDRQLLEESDDLALGLSAGFVGGGMVIVPEIDGVLSSRKYEVEAGFSWATPFRRIAPLLDDSLALHTAQMADGQRAEISYLGFGEDLFAIQQDMK